MAALKVTVLISGNGSNLQALIDARQCGRLDIEIARVISNRPDARGLQRAASSKIPCTILDHQEFPDRADFDLALANLIRSDQPDLVILAGFMRIIGASVLDQFAGRIINLHPSLLPLYRGTNTYQRALNAGDAEHGASIHFVTEELDGGPVISQVHIPILTNDDKNSLAARLAPMEHRLLVATMEFFTRHTVECLDCIIFVDGDRREDVLKLTTDDRLL